MKGIRYYYYKIMHPYGKTHFLLRYVEKNMQKVLDIGCGNNSVNSVKRNCPNCYYIGVDVGDYNLKPECKELMEEYHIVSPEQFANKILEFKDSADIVISNHNIEHCNEPEKVLNAMVMALKPGGNIFMAFPTEESINFPHRYGTLNFYDDNTHQNMPSWNAILSELESRGVRVVFKSKNYKPLLSRIWGRMNENRSKKKRKVLRGTWAYWGFESIIWGKKL